MSSQESRAHGGSSKNEYEKQHSKFIWKHSQSSKVIWKKISLDFPLQRDLNGDWLEWEKKKTKVSKSSTHFSRFQKNHSQLCLTLKALLDLLPQRGRPQIKMGPSTAGLQHHEEERALFCNSCPTGSVCYTNKRVQAVSIVGRVCCWGKPNLWVGGRWGNTLKNSLNTNNVCSLLQLVHFSYSL